MHKGLQVFGRLDRGGAETMVMNLYRQFDRNKIQFDFVIHTEEICDYTEEIKNLGGRIFSIPAFRSSTAFSYRKNWRNFFAEHKEFPIVHGHMRSTASIYLQEANKAGRVTIAHSHNTSSGHGVSALVKNILQFSIRYRADYLFSCSLLAGQWLYGKKACQSKRFVLLNNGILPDAFHSSAKVRENVRNEFQIKKDERMLLHIGRMEHQKNHRFLLEILKSFRELDKRNAGKGVRLLLCGVGPLEPLLKEQVREAGLDSSVAFLGIRGDIPQLMQAADMMVFPSFFEGLPVTLVEAQAAGLPVLMSDQITKEVVLTDLVRSCSLKKTAKEWAELMHRMFLEFDGNNREKYASIVADAGYDVRQNAKWLEEFYHQCSGLVRKQKDDV